MKYKNKGQNCCHLCCESTIRCCNEIGCRYCNKLVGEEDEEFPPFICYCCDYNEEDYEKKKTVFAIAIKHKEHLFGVINILQIRLKKRLFLI